jgi:hypothetical protein
MGDTLGVFSEAEVKGLSSSERKLLKEHIINSIRGSERIHEILGANPEFVRGLTKNKEIRKILRSKATPLKSRLRKKKK